jgi:hypothetical protein
LSAFSGLPYFPDFTGLLIELSGQLSLVLLCLHLDMLLDFELFLFSQRSLTGLELAK